MTTGIQARIESKYFDGEYTDLPDKEKLNVVEYELLRLEDEIDELKHKQKDMETLYDLLKDAHVSIASV